MSIDATNELDSPKIIVSTAHWESFQQSVRKQTSKRGPKSVFGDAGKRGSIYRWGLATAVDAEVRPLVHVLSRLACDRVPSKKLMLAAGDLSEAAEAFMASGFGQSESAVNAMDAVLWAAALPALMDKLEPHTWWQLAVALKNYRDVVLDHDHVHTASHLLIAGELGLTLGWRLPELPGVDRVVDSAEIAFEEWFEHHHEAVSASIERGGVEARLVLGSLIRCQRILRKIASRNLSRQQETSAQELATWAIALTTRSGTAAFSTIDRDAVADDLGAQGLLREACEFDLDSLIPALGAALGESHSAKRLTWSVSLPEAIHHDQHAKVAVLFPDWDVGKGRTHLDYSQNDIRVEMFAGGRRVVAGKWLVELELDGEEQQPCGEWSEVCEYTDDDVHYIEIEQSWTGDVVVQRQIMVVRDDRCVLMADAVLPAENSALPREITYRSQVPFAQEINITSLPETREFFLSDAKRRAMVIPMSASEWRIGPTKTKVDTSDEHGLRMSMVGEGRLYAPIWLDFQRRRFGRKRTWRQLTVGEQLRIVSDKEAVGYRIQVGSEQWLVYRSLAPSACRTILGKHLTDDFFASRFDPGDGGHEILVAVDDRESGRDEEA